MQDISWHDTQLRKRINCFKVAAVKDSGHLKRETDSAPKIRLLSLRLFSQDWMDPLRKTASKSKERKTGGKRERRIGIEDGGQEKKNSFYGAASFKEPFL